MKGFGPLGQPMVTSSGIYECSDLMVCTLDEAQEIIGLVTHTFTAATEITSLDCLEVAGIYQP